MGAFDRMSQVTVVCPMVPVSANVLRRKYRHFAAYGRYRDGWQRTLYGLISGRNRAWLESMAKLGKKMRLEASLLHRRAYDSDNAVASLKPVLDSLVRLHFLAGDDPAHLEIAVTQQKIRANETWLVIREADHA